MPFGAFLLQKGEQMNGFEEELSKLSLPELIELAIEIMNDIQLRLMEIAGEIKGGADG